MFIKIYFLICTLSIIINCINGAAISNDDSSSSAELVDYKVETTDTEQKFAYALSDGTAREEIVSIKNKGTDEEYIEISGSYTYRIGEDYFLVKYIADKNGYRAKVIQQDGSNPIFINPNVLKSLVG